MTKDSHILKKVESVVGEFPSSEEHGISLLHDRLVGLDADEYKEITDISLLLEIIAILEGTAPTAKLNPSVRSGRLLPIDEWEGLASFKALKSLAENRGWNVEYRKDWVNFRYHNRLFFQVRNVRKSVEERYSCMLIVQGIVDQQALEVFLDTYDCTEYLDRNWSISPIHSKQKNKEAFGRYFFIEEIERLVIEITARV